MRQDGPTSLRTLDGSPGTAASRWPRICWILRPGHNPRTSRILTALVEIVASCRAHLLRQAAKGFGDCLVAVARRVLIAERGAGARMTETGHQLLEDRASGSGERAADMSQAAARPCPARPWSRQSGFPRRQIGVLAPKAGKFAPARPRCCYRAALIRRRKSRPDAAPITRPAILPSGEITSVLGKAATGISRLNSAAMRSTGSLRLG